MFLIYLIVNYLYRKYGVPLHKFFENLTRGISHLKERPFDNTSYIAIFAFLTLFFIVVVKEPFFENITPR